MIYIIQLIYLEEGQEQVFDQFEKIAIPIISRYNGRLLLRIRPDGNSFVEGCIEKPYEIHLAEFGSQQDFEGFSKDEERRKFLNLKDQAIKASMLIVGKKL